MKWMPRWRGAAGRRFWRGSRRRFAPGLTIVCLMLCCGCSARTETVSFAPPDLLLRDVTPPILEGPTNADLLDYTLALRAALASSNADKAALRAWAAALPGREAYGRIY